MVPAESASTIQTLLSVSELHRFCANALADFTAGREFHPALKKLIELTIGYHGIWQLSTQTKYGKMLKLTVEN